MLTQKKELPYIGIFKTGSGEEFIAKVIEETMMSFTVKSPLCMVATERGMSFAPFMMMSDPDKAITIPKPIITGLPPLKLEEQYEQVLSPIALPPKM